MTLRRAMVIFVAVFAMVASGIQALPLVFSANGLGERLANANFEEGFGPDGVATGWKSFDNGGRASYGRYDETWGKVIYEGKHAQLIEINSTSWFPTDPDRYSGIYQTVSVVPGQPYQLTINALMRSTEGDMIASGYGYRVQYGIDLSGGQNWTTVPTWVDIGLNNEYPRTNPGPYFTYVATVTPTSNRLTLFIRGWKKWAQPNREFDLDLDAVSLKGTTPVDMELPLVSITVPPFPMTGIAMPVSVHASNDVGITQMTVTDNGATICSASSVVGVLTLDKTCDWKPSTAGPHTLVATVTDVTGTPASFTNSLIVGQVVEYLVNGSFEGGFQANGVANSWTSFNNDGRSRYGYYDETWQPATFDGANAQLIEINTINLMDNDPDRYSGIFQRVTGLTPGAMYQLTVRAMMRTTEANFTASGYGYRVQFGLDMAGGNDWHSVSNWADIGMNSEFPRLSPGNYFTFTTWVTPASDSLTLYVRGWKKWAQPNREFDLDIDGLSLRGYQ
jgi:hypothetical protein